MTAGPVLGEDARDKLAELLLLDQVAATQSGARQAASYILDTLAPHVAALVAEAERRGEARGARAERDRIAAEIEAEADRIDQRQQGWAPLMKRAAHIARDASS